MNQSEKWVSQRLQLLRTHVQEWKDNARQEAQARNELVAKHQTEKEHRRQGATTLEWANYLTLYVERLTNLSIANEQGRQVISSRQQQETTDLEAQIHQEHLRG